MKLYLLDWLLEEIIDVTEEENLEIIKVKKVESGVSRDVIYRAELEGNIELDYLDNGFEVWSDSKRNVYYPVYQVTGEDLDYDIEDYYFDDNYDQIIGFVDQNFDYADVIE